MQAQKPKLSVGDYVRPSNPKHPRHHVTFEVCAVTHHPALAPTPSRFAWPGHPGHDEYWSVAAVTTSPYGDDHALHMAPDGWTKIEKALAA
jgi:hypothetical protein